MSTTSNLTRFFAEFVVILVGVLTALASEKSGAEVSRLNTSPEYPDP